jgi:group I intron endonuclease
MFATSEPISMIIYLVECLGNGKRYVGQTTFDLATRWRDHKSAAAGRTSNSILHKAIRKYGAENFSIREVAGASSVEELDALEIQFIRDLGTVAPGGYNQAEGGRNNRKGVKASEETRARLRAAWVGRKQKFGMPTALLAHCYTPGHSPGNKGKPFSEEVKSKMAESARAIWTPERRAAQAVRLANQKKQNPRLMFRGGVQDAPSLVEK